MVYFSWGDKMTKTFSTKLEVKTLDRLQNLRRDTENPASGEEILQQYRRQKLDQGMLELLSRHVRIDPISPNPANSNATEIFYSSPSVSWVFTQGFRRPLRLLDGSPYEGRHFCYGCGSPQSNASRIDEKQLCESLPRFSTLQRKEVESLAHTRSAKTRN